MEHGQTLPQVTADAHHDPADFVAEEARIKKSQPNYIGVFVILGVLTATEIGITRIWRPDQTVGTIPILLTLTVAKALLVILYYMHLKFDSRLYSFFFGAGVLAFALPFVIAMVFLMSPPQLASSRQPGEANAGGGTEQRATPNPNAGPPISVSVAASEFQFAPPALQANAGQVVRLELKNTGSVEHTFVLASKTKSEDAQPWQTNDGKLVARAGAGSSGKGGFTAPGPGEWIYYCNIPGHAPAGMFGILTVK